MVLVQILLVQINELPLKLVLLPVNHSQVIFHEFFNVDVLITGTLSGGASG